MAGAYKVRLEDGVEVGPLDVEMLRSWWQQGMLNRDTKVKAQGGKSWRPLGEAVDIQDWGASGVSGTSRGSGPRGGEAPADVDFEDDEEAGPQTIARLWACAATATVLRNGLAVLGVHAPERM